MQFLASGPEDNLNHSLVSGDNFLLPHTPRQPYTIMNGEPEAASPFQLGRLLRKYWLLLLVLTIVGAAAGFTSVVLSSPIYRSRLLLEIQNHSGVMGTEVSNAEASEVDAQTQVTILHSGSFLKRGADLMQSENVVLAPTGRGIFSRLRQRIHPATQDPMEAARTGLAVAMGSFDARPVNRTRLIELTTQSTSPDVAAQFLNSMAKVFIEESTRSRTSTAQKTVDWLAVQIDETKSRVQEAETRLGDFVQASGNVFAQETTLDDTKLGQLKAELARIQAERISKQTNLYREAR
jgi:uncharacterized protein involved in exopolysaccharide biosynthesis